MLQRRATVPPSRYLLLQAGALSCAVSGALLCAATAAHAEGADVFTLSAAAAIAQDSNLFRLPDQANLPALIGSNSGSDQITITTLGVKFSKDYSLQHLELDLNLANYHYLNFSQLNSTANNYSAKWRWSVTPRVQGNITTERKETLNDFTDVRGSQTRNQRTNVTSRFDGSYALDGAWHLTAGATEATQTNPQFQVADADTLTRSVDAGVRYVYASGSQWSYNLRTAQGSYRIAASPTAAQIDDGFDQINHELALRWALDGKSAANFRISALNRSHPKFSQRNFDGVDASANYQLSLTGKTSVSAGIARELGSYQTSTSNYTQTDRLSLAPAWSITTKTLLRLNYVLAQRSYLGAPTALAANTVRRVDTTNDTTLSLDWQPQPHLTLSAAVQDSRRSVNLANLDFQSTTASLSAQISF